MAATSILLFSLLAADPCSTANASTVVAGPTETGQRMVVRGTVFQPDGVTPAAGVVMYVYQTGADGEYHPDASGVPRLRGWMRTGSKGEYEYTTIRPGPYPGSRNPAHVHVQFWGAGAVPQINNELLFADDPYLGEEQRRRSASLGRFAYVKQPENRNGTLAVTQDFRLKHTADPPSGGVAHGMQACSGSR